MTCLNKSVFYHLETKLMSIQREKPELGGLRWNGGETYITLNLCDQVTEFLCASGACRNVLRADKICNHLATNVKRQNSS